jgi:hypothetical protein
MSTSLSIGRYFGLTFVGIMAVGYIVILIVKLGNKTPKPMMSERSRMVFWLSALGLPAFLIGLVLAILPELGHMSLGITLVAGGFLATVASTFLNAILARSKRAAWPVVIARCTKRELQKRQFATDGDSADGWLCQVVCELDMGGKHYVVNPKVHWSDLGQADAPFWSEEKAQQYISRKVAPAGECKLRVNPTNPHEAELL